VPGRVNDHDEARARAAGQVGHGLDQADGEVDQRLGARHDFVVARLPVDALGAAGLRGQDAPGPARREEVEEDGMFGEPERRPRRRGQAEMLRVQLERAVLDAEVRLGMDAVVEEDGKRVVGEVIGEAEVEENDPGRGPEPFALELDPLLVRAVAGHAQIHDVEARLQEAELGGQRFAIVHVEAEGHGVAQGHETRTNAVVRCADASPLRVDRDVPRGSGQRDARPQLPSVDLGVRVQAGHELGGGGAGTGGGPPPAEGGLDDHGQGQCDHRRRSRQQQLAASGSSARQAQPPDSAASASRPGGVASSRSSR
jgi:hypothetical protein